MNRYVQLSSDLSTVISVIVADVSFASVSELPLEPIPDNLQVQSGWIRIKSGQYVPPPIDPEVLRASKIADALVVTSEIVNSGAIWGSLIVSIDNDTATKLLAVVLANTNGLITFPQVWVDITGQTFEIPDIPTLNMFFATIFGFRKMIEEASAAFVSKLVQAAPEDVASIVDTRIVNSPVPESAQK